MVPIFRRTINLENPINTAVGDTILAMDLKKSEKKLEAVLKTIPQSGGGHARLILLEAKKAISCQAERIEV